MIVKNIIRRILLIIGAGGFISVSLGAVLLVIKYRPAFTAICLIIAGIAQLVFFCHPYARKRVFPAFVIIDSVMACLMVIGLANTVYTEMINRITGLSCFFLGLLLNSAVHILLLSAMLSRDKADAGEKEILYEELRKKLFENIHRVTLHK